MLNGDIFRVLMAVFLFVIAIFAYINSVIWRRKEYKKYFFTLANLYMCVVLWLASMCDLIDFFMKKPIFSYLISMFMALIIPVAVYEFVKIVYKKPNKCLLISGYIAWGNFTAQLILQFAFGISFLDMLPVLYFVYAAGSIFYIFLIVKEIATSKGDINFNLVSLLVVLVGAIIEIIVLCIFPEKTNMIGFSSVLGLFAYLILNHFNILLTESKLDVKNLELEENYNQLQNTTLMQQIKGHFFFNTLNTISALCKYDVKEANNAINIFANYMRQYMNTISESKNISFTKELEIVESTLKIEKLRYPDTFIYEIDLEFTDFKIPPLSIQPIIENSIIHGLRRTGNKGVISVKTVKFANEVHVIISDNGVGFDTSILKNTESIGLKNLKNRLHIMSKAKMKIESEKDKGTTTTLIIPI